MSARDNAVLLAGLLYYGNDTPNAVNFRAAMPVACTIPIETTIGILQRLWSEARHPTIATPCHLNHTP